MKRIAIALLVAMLVSLAVVSVAAAEWPPYYYAGWRDCFPPGCIPPYHYGMYGSYGYQGGYGNYYSGYSHGYYDGSYGYPYSPGPYYHPTYYYYYSNPYPYYPVVYGGHAAPFHW